MLGSVTPSQRFEQLENHILRKRGRPPTDVSGFDVSARQPVDFANAVIPGLKTPIPSSSARPGKMTNQNIPYTRIMHVFPNNSNPIVNQSIMEGDVVFVNRKVHEGVGTNRTSKICNLKQLNAVLSDHGVSDRGKFTMQVAGASPFSDPTLTWEERWSKCTEIQNWLPDGVVLTAEHQHERPYHNIGSTNSNPGEAFNVVVQGPIATEKADMKPRLLDVVYACLFSKLNQASATVTEPFYSFYWELNSDYEIQTMKRSSVGLEKLKSMITKFKIGKTMDYAATPEKVTVNVCIEELITGNAQPLQIPSSSGSSTLEAPPPPPPASTQPPSLTPSVPTPPSATPSAPSEPTPPASTQPPSLTPSVPTPPSATPSAPSAPSEPTPPASTQPPSSTPSAPSAQSNKTSEQPTLEQTRTQPTPTVPSSSGPAATSGQNSTPNARSRTPASNPAPTRASEPVPAKAPAPAPTQIPTPPTPASPANPTVPTQTNKNWLNPGGARNVI